MNFTDLEVYKACRNLRKEVSDFVKVKLPQEEKYKLYDQIIRSSRSITANIAEGYGRYYYKENIQFCRISRGSLNETLEHFICELLICKRDTVKPITNTPVINSPIY